MKVIFTSIFCFYLAVLPSTIQGAFEKHIQRVNTIAAKGGIINKVFKPSENGSLGHGSTSFAYRGIFIKTNATIAMKFFQNEKDAEDEIAAYSTLGAKNDTKEKKYIEDYGVPKVYHYSVKKWKGFTLMGITLLDLEFTQRISNGSLRLTDGDFLILFREMVRITKYIHSRGICHRHLRLKNLMFRNNQGFIMNYGKSTNVEGGDGIVCQTYDWRGFLRDFAELFDVQIDVEADETQVIRVKLIPEDLRNIFLESWKTAYEDAKLNYDHVYKIINAKIDERFGRRKPLLSWITPDKAINNRIPPIEAIQFK